MYFSSFRSNSPIAGNSDGPSIQIALSPEVVRSQISLLTLLPVLPADYRTGSTGFKRLTDYQKAIFFSRRCILFF